MPWYGDWITPPLKTTQPGIVREFTDLNKGGMSTVPSQETGLAAGPAAAQGTSTVTAGSKTGNTSHTEAGYPGGSYSVGHSTEIQTMVPNPVTVFNDPPALIDYGTADGFEYNPGTGHLVSHLATLRSSGLAAGYSSDGSTSSQRYDGIGGLFYDTAFAFTLDGLGKRLWPGPVWRSWASVGIASGVETDVAIPLPAVGARIAFVPAPNIMTNPVALGSIGWSSPSPSRVSQQVYASLFKMEAIWQPNQYRFIWNDDNPPPWLTLGRWQSRQRQRTTGNSGGFPSRQRQRGGDSGAWNSRQK